MMLMCVGDDVRVGERPGSRLWWPPTQKSRFKVMRTYLGKTFASASAQWVACGTTDAEESSLGDVHLRGEDVRFGDRPGGHLASGQLRGADCRKCCLAIYAAVSSRGGA